MIHVIATVTLREGGREAFLAILKDNLPRVLAEEGCRAYTPTVDVPSGMPLQPAPRADVVTLIEAWDSLDHLRAHLKTPHMLAYREKVKGLVANVALDILAPA